MAFRQVSHVAALVLSVAVLAGCGQASIAPTAVEAEGFQAKVLRGHGGFGAHGKKMGHGDAKGGPILMFAGLDLTEAQRTELKAIAEKYRPERPEQPAEKPGAKLQELLAAETLDVEAIKAALAERPTRIEGGGDRLAMLAEARAVLTDAQRATLVERLKAAPVPAERPVKVKRAEQHGPSAASLAEKLGLTEEQKAAFEAFRAKLEADRATLEPPAHDPAAHRDAMVAFLETGDAAKLEALKPEKAEPPAFPVDEFVALAQSLSVEQRKALLHGPGHGFGKHKVAFGPGRGGRH